MLTVGQLYVRVVNGEPSELFYPTEEATTVHQLVKSIASRRCGISEMSFFSGPFINQSGLVGVYPAEIRPALGRDIQAFYRNCPKDARPGLRQWYESVLNCDKMLDIERIRLGAILNGRQ